MNYENFKGKDFLVLDGEKYSKTKQMPTHKKRCFSMIKITLFHHVLMKMFLTSKEIFRHEGLFQSEKYL